MSTTSKVGQGTQTGASEEMEVNGPKTIVLDTSVLLNDPESIFAFPGDDIVLPFRVIEELDNHKSRTDDVGRAARETGRLLEQIRVSAPKNQRDLRTAVALANGGTLRIELNGLLLDAIKEKGLDVKKSDNRILAAALGLKQRGGNVKLISADVNLRIKAATLGLETGEHLQATGQVHNEKYPGWYQLDVDTEMVNTIFKEHFVAFEDMTKDQAKSVSKLKVNEYGVLKSQANTSVLVRRTRRKGKDGLEQLDRSRRSSAWGLKARSKEQAFALDLLLDPEVPIVGLSGRAGTGKTIMAVASALEQTFESGATYERVMILRPIVAVGNQDLGYLPGTLEEKLGPWMEAIVDAMVALRDDKNYADAKTLLDGWVDEGRLTLESVTFLRGRSLQKTFIVVDEAQNLEPLTLKTILTRVGEGSKVVLVGDVSQIDNPWASERSNAISILADRFNGKELFGHLVLTKGERSAVADMAAELL